MTRFNGHLNFNTVYLREMQTGLVSWWAEPMSYPEFTQKAREEFPRMRHSQGASWASVMGQDSAVFHVPPRGK